MTHISLTPQAHRISRTLSVLSLTALNPLKSQEPEPRADTTQPCPPFRAEVGFFHSVGTENTQEEGFCLKL